MAQMSPKLANTAVILILLALSFLILANGMTKPLGRDEQMYCTAGVLLAQGKAIYKDFAYPSQLPYHPLLYAALFKTLNTTRFLLVARLTSVTCDILVLICIFGIYRRIFRHFGTSAKLLALGACVLYVFNPLVDYAHGYAWNHNVVILCVVLSFWLFISPDKSKYRQAAAIGALLTFATCMRITTALLQLIFFAFLLARPADSAKQRLKNVLPFAAATALLLIWPVTVAARAGPAFLLNLFRIPALYGQWLHEIGMVHNKPQLIVTCLARPGYLVLILMAVYLTLLIARQRKKLIIADPKSLLLAVLLTLAFFVIALIPPTIWRQYLALPVPFLIIALAYPLLYLRKAAASRQYKIAAALTAFCVLVAVVSHPAVLYRAPALLVPESWVPSRLHQTAEDISQNTTGTKRVLTLAPLFALEGRCEIYPELSAGAIVYRIADRMKPSDRALTSAAGPQTIGPLLENQPPAAVILGVEMERLEQPLFEAVIQPQPQKWIKKTYQTGPVVYFRR
jgi:4-amino-4-deoxy-L-arabinose transferase-like glycosyltransferase